MGGNSQNLEGSFLQSKETREDTTHKYDDLRKLSYQLRFFTSNIMPIISNKQLQWAIFYLLY